MFFALCGRIIISFMYLDRSYLLNQGKSCTEQLQQEVWNVKLKHWSIGQKLHRWHDSQFVGLRLSVHNTYTLTRSDQNVTYYIWSLSVCLIHCNKTDEELFCSSVLEDSRLEDRRQEFLCPSERKFPELFKTHPTFVYSAHLVPSMACQTLTGVFLGHPVWISNTTIWS